MLQAGEQILEFNIHTEEDVERIGIYRENHEDATNKVDVSGDYIKTKTASLTNTVIKYDEPENPDPEEPDRSARIPIGSGRSELFRL